MQRYRKQLLAIYFNNKRWSYTLLLLLSVFWHFQFIAPFLVRIDQKMQSYTKALQQTMPTLIISDHRLTIDGALPKHIILPDTIDLWFTHAADSNLIRESKKYSCVLSDTVLLVKNSSRIYRLKLDNVNIDSVHTITGDWLLLKSKKLHYQLFYPLQLVGMAIIFLGLLLFAYFCAGIGLLADAFNNGPFSFTELFQMSVLLLCLDTIILWISIKAGVNFFLLLLPVMALTLIGIFLFTLYNVHHPKKEVLQ